uniref:Uncharacterized protein n=1 Tax=uncultured Desulfobacterium sp. TaxID=201089 RepID=E1YKM3_9BACT|nr:unknown protein [uncultured Desulfobacterium sp.]
MNKITESAIEKFTIEMLEKSGYQYRWFRKKSVTDFCKKY